MHIRIVGKANLFDFGASLGIGQNEPVLNLGSTDAQIGNAVLLALGVDLGGKLRLADPQVAGTHVGNQHVNTHFQNRDHFLISLACRGGSGHGHYQVRPVLLAGLHQIPSNDESQRLACSSTGIRTDLLGIDIDDSRHLNALFLAHEPDEVGTNVADTSNHDLYVFHFLLPFFIRDAG